MQKHFGLIGFPLGHTMSPFIQAQLFDINKIGADYTLFSFPAREFDKNIKRLNKLDGFNITIPHKQNIIKYLDFIDDNAKLYGAVNTVNITDGKMYGYNTDAYGFLSGLEFANLELKGKVLVYGYGGVARTICFEAAKRDCDLTICTRKGCGERALPLANEIKSVLKRDVKIISEDKLCSEYDLFVNASPVGMFPNCDASPLTDAQLRLFKGVYDTVYNPYDTLLCKKAAELNITASNGLAMLVCQAAQAQSIWCGVSFTKPQLRKVIELTKAKLGEF